MNREQFLKLSFQSKSHLFTSWWTRALAEFTDLPGVAIEYAPYTLIKQPWGMSVRKPDGEYEKLDGYEGTGPVFSIESKVTVTPEWLPNISSTIETDLGILGANAIVLVEPFGSKIPYMNREVSIGEIEKIIAPSLESNPPPGTSRDNLDPSKFYVFELKKLGQAVEFISAIMDLFTITLTQKTLLPPPGIEEYRKELLSDPSLDLNDPIQLSAYESKLLAFDREYLKDDPSYGKFASGKMLADSRKKLFLSMGAEGGFGKRGEIVGISRTLDEGLPTEPTEWAASLNGSRAGSYSRGAETQEGGVAAKKMLAASNNYVIKKGDCGSTMGITRLYTKEILNSIRGRTVINGTSQTKVAKNADVSSYLGKHIRTRSPMYCRLPGETICSVCAGDSMARYETGISIPLTEISHSILIARMKAMHTNALKVNDFDINTVFT